MNNEIYNDLQIEQAAERDFAEKLEIKQVIVRGIPVGRSVFATVFLTNRNQLYAYISGQTALLLDDIRKIAGRMGLEVDEFVPPHGNPDYFNAIGREKFKEVFPGRHITSDEDIEFYRRLSPYNPALIKIAAIKDSEIKQCDPNSGIWRTATTYAYRKIHTD